MHIVFALIALVIWMVVGFLLWVPLLFRTTSIYCALVMARAIAGQDTRGLGHAFDAAIQFYPMGFRRIFLSFDEDPGNDPQPLAWGKVILEVSWTVLFWTALMLLTLIRMAFAQDTTASYPPRVPGSPANVTATSSASATVPGADSASALPTTNSGGDIPTPLQPKDNNEPARQRTDASANSFTSPTQKDLGARGSGSSTVAKGSTGTTRIPADANVVRVYGSNEPAVPDIPLERWGKIIDADKNGRSSTGGDIPPDSAMSVDFGSTTTHFYLGWCVARIRNSTEITLHYQISWDRKAWSETYAIEPGKVADCSSKGQFLYVRFDSDLSSRYDEKIYLIDSIITAGPPSLQETSTAPLHFFGWVEGNAGRLDLWRTSKGG